MSTHPWTCCAGPSAAGTGGQLLVGVPNIDSLPYRWFGPTWYGLDLPRHLTHFSPWTLQQMLERGFQLQPVRMVRHSDWMRSSAKLANRPPGAALVSLADQQARLGAGQLV